MDQISTLRKLEILTSKRNTEAARVFEESLARLSEKLFAHSRYFHFRFFFFFYLKAAEAAAAELVDDCQVFNLRSLIHHGGIFFTLLVRFLKYIFRQAGRGLLPRDSSSFFAFPIHSLVLYADR